MEANASPQFETATSFINKWISTSQAESILHINMEGWNTLPSIDYPNIHTVSLWNEFVLDTQYDLIIGDLPIYMMKVDYDYHGEHLRIQQNWKEILNSLDYLKDNGTALYVLEPMGFGTKSGKKFEALLNKNDLYISAFIKLPEGILRPLMSITPVIVVITKRVNSTVFVDELIDPAQAEYLVDNYFLPANKLVSDNYIPAGTFRGFARLKIERQIERLKTQYKNYSQRTIGELAIEINTVPSGGTFTEKPNSIYIPRIGKSPVVSNLEDTTLKHQNYYQIVLDQSVDSAYLVAFFRSTLGRLILGSSFSETFISSVNKSDVKNLLVAFPKPEEQQSINQTISLLSRVKDALDGFDSEMALNPTSSSSIQPRLASMLAAINGLTESEKIYALIREGESKKLEFKETLSLDVEKQTKEKYIETSALKTLVAFLNSEGGNLLVGVSDSGVIKGLNKEIEKFDSTRDAFFLRWKNLIKEHIGEPFYPFIDYRLIDVEGRLVLFVECQPSPKLECYLDNKDFYVRTNPATDKLEGPKLVEYIRIRFPS